jgi:hypothetical protein
LEVRKLPRKDTSTPAKTVVMAPAIAMVQLNELVGRERFGEEGDVTDTRTTI